jgi:hypothetical protein
MDVAGQHGCGCGDLRFRQCRHLVGHHPPGLGGAGSAAARQPHEPQGDHALRVQAELRGLEADKDKAEYASYGPDAATKQVERQSGKSSQPAEQDQDQKDDDHEPESAPAVVAGAVEATAADPAEPAEQDDDQDNEQDRSKRHGELLGLRNDMDERLPVGQLQSRRPMRPISQPAQSATNVAV